MSPKALQSILNRMPTSKPDIDGYEADTSISISDTDDCSDTPQMTSSDDFFISLLYWHVNPASEHSIDEPTPTPRIPSVSMTAAAAPCKYDPSSTTEPESDEPTAPIASTDPALKSATTITPHKYDPGSTTEPESDKDKPAATTVTPTASTLEQKSFFATPSPPGPDSIYWKYVSHEEDAAWYDRSGTDDRFHTVHQMKRELQQLCDQ